MAIRNIVKEGDPILNKVCRPVTNFDDRLATLLDDMRETMIAADGVGLAGPQVGMMRRLFVVCLLYTSFWEECVGKVESLSAGRVENYTNRLYEKLKVILQDRDIDDARVLTEAAIFGDKTAVDEETVRLRSHIAQYRDCLLYTSRCV